MFIFFPRRACTRLGERVRGFAFFCRERARLSLSTSTPQPPRTPTQVTAPRPPPVNVFTRRRRRPPPSPAATPQPAPAERDGAPDAAPLADKPFPAVISFPDRSPAPVAELSPSQKAFLARKAAYLAGTGPLFPPESCCPECDGLGSYVCRGCNGTSLNPPGFVAPRGLVLEDARQFNGRVDVTSFLLPGGLCFSCAGKALQACKACEGTGFAEGRMEMFSGD